MTSLVLVPCIASKVSIPVICAGGIANGQGLLAMLALGADGVAMVLTGGMGDPNGMGRYRDAITPIRRWIARLSGSTAWAKRRLERVYSWAQ